MAYQVFVTCDSKRQGEPCSNWECFNLDGLSKSHAKLVRAELKEKGWKVNSFTQECPSEIHDTEEK